MLYVRKWERLSDTLSRVKERYGLPKAEVQRAICQAIADGAVRIQGKLKRHTTRSMTSKAILGGEAFQVPVTIEPDNFDWENSRPLKPWFVGRGTFAPSGSWELQWIEVCRADVTDVLCVSEQDRTTTRNASNQAPAIRASQPAPPGAREMLGADGAEPQNPGAAGSPRPRGKQPKKFERTRDAMMSEIQQGLLSVAELKRMLEKNLSERYGVSRDTARKARNAVLREQGEN
jgi:hypothetical protein